MPRSFLQRMQVILIVGCISRKVFPLELHKTASRLIPSISFYRIFSRSSKLGEHDHQNSLGLIYRQCFKKHHNHLSGSNHSTVTQRTKDNHQWRRELQCKRTMQKVFKLALSQNLAQRDTDFIVISGKKKRAQIRGDRNEKVCFRKNTQKLL